MRRSMRARGSRPLAGSSRMSTSGSWTRARASESRCFMPRDSELTCGVALAVEVDELEQAVEQRRPRACGGCGRRRRRTRGTPRRWWRRRRRGRRACSRPGAGRRRVVDRVGAGDPHRAGGRLQERGEHRHGRGLAGAVRADEPVGGAPGHVEVEVAHGEERAVALREAPARARSARARRRRGGGLRRTGSSEPARSCAASCRAAGSRPAPSKAPKSLQDPAPDPHHAVGDRRRRAGRRGGSG